MNDAVRALLDSFGPIETAQDEKNALQEIIQRIVLLGLHRGGFFERSAFYGGTALRILYGLDRFSEDLDFCLTDPDPDFSIAEYFPSIQSELERFDFSAELSEKRTGPDNVIESAFVKQSTYQGLLVIDRDPHGIHKEQLTKVRIEVDKLNPTGGDQTERLIQLPIPFLVRTLTLPSLFAGKLHAIIARSYLNRVKGRDYYDLAFYLARGTPVNLRYLEAKLRDSGNYEEEEPLSVPKLVEMLKEKFRTVDFQKAREDAAPFIRSTATVAVEEWSEELYSAMVEQLKPEDDKRDIR